jgi:hypothetical protein
MNKLEWHAKLLEWVEIDPRLKRLPYVHIDALEEHLAEYEAAQHRLQSDKRVCTCESHGSEYLKNDVWLCGYCKLPLAAKA